jgi:hypothetical protein
MDFSRDSQSSDSPAPFLQPPGAGTTQLIKKKSSEEDLAARWEAELDDDDLLIDDELTANATATTQMHEVVSANGVEAANQNTGFGTQQGFAQAQVNPNLYAPHQPSTAELTQGLPLPAYGQGGSGSVLPSGDKAESFVDRSKEGYKSPYDLPMDLTLPRKHTKTPRPVVSPVTAMPPPPPRSSSIASIPPASASMVSPPLAAALPSTPPVTTPKNFYEELPLPSSSRPASRGRYTPQPVAAATIVAPMQPASAPPPAALPTVHHPPAADSYASQLQQPERMDPYSNLLVPSVPSAGPGAASRYSPRPPGQLGVKPPPSPRYSPAPPPQTSGPPSRSQYPPHHHDA